MQLARLSSFLLAYGDWCVGSANVRLLALTATPLILPFLTGPMDLMQLPPMTTYDGGDLLHPPTSHYSIFVDVIS